MTRLGCVQFVLYFAVLGPTWADSQEGEGGCLGIFEALPGTGLDPKSFDNGAVYAAHLEDISDAESCEKACCAHSRCSLALLNRTGARTLCHLVTCVAESTGEDACIATPNAAYDSYRKRESDYRSSSNEEEKCHAPIEVGPCRAAFPRFNYDPVNQTCTKFIYGGCKGNANNYKSKEDCEGACAGVRADKDSHNSTLLVSKRMARPMKHSCEVAPVVGPCRASMPRFFYNSSSGSCQLFIYGGCQGNNNNYQTQAECQAKCSENLPPVPMPMMKQSAEYKDQCLAEPEVGPCRAAFPSWYYDSNVQDCLPFIFGGCGGNLNRYSSAQDCISRCAGGPEANGQHHGHGFLKHRTVYILTAVMAVVMVILVMGLIFVCLRKARECQLLVGDDKEELLPSSGSEKA
ncbi:kunitz-type protease inhibitor 1-like isoform X2 [Polyodon spathula]|uniref:kunitz-type protease inhibitor 1-like isoform X2 n=1 Tax=Polyodon spathula TaxID=7913 RepID=UPI001B7D9F92|nr:kunitz-type protease inhibitor 1-like isoform X2 [Polyodon spathula]